MIDTNKIKVASPCSVPWESMTGDERVRKCDDCGLNVHNLAAMNESEIDQLLANRQGRICIRLYRRKDGTVLTQDCPTGLRAHRKRAARLITAVFSTVLGLVSISFGQDKKSDDHKPYSIKVERKDSDEKVGQVTGVVTDVNGAVIPGIGVKLSLEGKEKSLTVTDSNGQFAIKDVAAAEKYTLDVGSKNSPFKQASIRNIQVAEGEQLNISVSLEVDGESVVVGILAEEPMIDIGSSTVETRISRRKLESIPHK